MKQAVAYYRVSTKTQKKSGLGLEAQAFEVHNYARNNGIEVVKEFKEIESGNKRKRPILKRALAFCRKHNLRLLILNVSRLARNVLFFATLMESDIRFTAVDKPHADEFTLYNDAVHAYKEYKETKKRVKEALQAAKRRGVQLGTYGKIRALLNRHDADKFILTLKPIIENIRQCGHTSIRAITAELKHRRIKTYRGRRRWQKTTVHNLLLRLKEIDIANDNFIDASTQLSYGT